MQNEIMKVKANKCVVSNKAVETGLLHRLEIGVVLLERLNYATGEN